VDSVTEYLTLCEALASQADDRHEIFFRGQTNEFLVPGSDKISLMPVAARVAPIQPDIEARYLLEQRYRQYVKSMVDEHLSAIGISDKRMSDFVKLFTGLKWRSPRNLLNYAHNNLDLVGHPLSRLLSFLTERNLNTMSIEAILQHYEIPTLCLDVTISPLVALFFATHHNLVPQQTGGVVYVLIVDKRALKRGPSQHAALHFPRFQPLHDIFHDNDIRPRRQGGAILMEIHWGNFGEGDEPIPDVNAYTRYLACAIHLTTAFYQDKDYSDYFSRQNPARYYPDRDVDALLGKLRSTRRKHIPLPKTTGGMPDPIGRFVLLSGRMKIALTGSAASVIDRILFGSWLQQGCVLEVQSKEVIRRRISSARAQVDIVVFCEFYDRVVATSPRLSPVFMPPGVLPALTGITKLAAKHDRIIGTVCVGVPFSYANAAFPMQTMRFGGGLLLQWDWQGLVDSALFAILNELRCVNDMRMRRWLVPAANRWTEFFDWQSHLRTR
jgi:hypothetical protein